MQKILEEVKNNSLIAISGHVRPDGDCIGSSMGPVSYTHLSHGGNRGSIPLLAVKMSENTVFSDIFLFDRKVPFQSNKKYDYAHLRAGETAFLRKSIA